MGDVIIRHAIDRADILLFILILIYAITLSSLADYFFAMLLLDYFHFLSHLMISLHTCYTADYLRLRDALLPLRHGYCFRCWYFLLRLSPHAAFQRLPPRLLSSPAMFSACHAITPRMNTGAFAPFAASIFAVLRHIRDDARRCCHAACRRYFALMLMMPPMRRACAAMEAPVWCRCHKARRAALARCRCYVLTRAPMITWGRCARCHCAAMLRAVISSMRFIFDFRQDSLCAIAINISWLSYHTTRRISPLRQRWFSAAALRMPMIRCLMPLRHYD